MGGEQAEGAVDPEEAGGELRVGVPRAGRRGVPPAEWDAGDARPAGVRHGLPGRQDDDVGAGHQPGAGPLHGRLHDADRGDVPDPEVLAGVELRGYAPPLVGLEEYGAVASLCRRVHTIINGTRFSFSILICRVALTCMY